MSVKIDSQAGSATSFVIIAIILVAVTIGGISFVVQRGNQVRKDAVASKIADQEATQQAKNAEIAKNSTTNKPITPNTNPTSTVTQNSDTKKAADLPKTGIETNIAQLLAIGLLSYTATGFVQSRRSLKRSL